MEAGKRTINDIFTGTRVLEIPFFQRAYVWDEPQWERLLEDVESVCKTRTPYFMGAVILKQQHTSSDSSVGDVWTIIDGQQRLTTISILLKVLSLITNSLNRYAKGIEIFSEYLDLEIWNENTIKTRAAELAKYALEVWNI